MPIRITDADEFDTAQGADADQRLIMSIWERAVNAERDWRDRTDRYDDTALLRLTVRRFGAVATLFALMDTRYGSTSTERLNNRELTVWLGTLDEAGYYQEITQQVKRAAGLPRVPNAIYPDTNIWPQFLRLVSAYHVMSDKHADEDDRAQARGNILRFSEQLGRFAATVTGPDDPVEFGPKWWCDRAVQYMGLVNDFLPMGTHV